MVIANTLVQINKESTTAIATMATVWIGMEGIAQTLTNVQLKTVATTIVSINQEHLSALAMMATVLVNMDLVAQI
jgi:hypothetical protein